MMPARQLRIQQLEEKKTEVISAGVGSFALLAGGATWMSTNLHAHAGFLGFLGSLLMVVGGVIATIAALSGHWGAIDKARRLVRFYTDPPSIGPLGIVQLPAPDDDDWEEQDHPHYSRAAYKHRGSDVHVIEGSNKAAVWAGKSSVYMDVPEGYANEVVGAQKTRRDLAELDAFTDKYLQRMIDS